MVASGRTRSDYDAKRYDLTRRLVSHGNVTWFSEKGPGRGPVINDLSSRSTRRCGDLQNRCSTYLLFIRFPSSLSLSISISSRPSRVCMEIPSGARGRAAVVCFSRGEVLSAAAAVVLMMMASVVVVVAAETILL